MPSPDGAARLPSADRRRFLKRGVFGGLALVVLGAGTLALRRGRGPARAPRGLAVLDAATYATLMALAARMVPGDDARGWPSAEELGVGSAVDQVLAGLHPHDARDFVRFLGLLDNGLFSLVSAGSWACYADLPTAEQDARLARWSQSRLALVKSGLVAVKRLVHATYYASPKVYPLIGYPGPSTMGGGTP